MVPLLVNNNPLNGTDPLGLQRTVDGCLQRGGEVITTPGTTAGALQGRSVGTEQCLAPSSTGQSTAACGAHGLGDKGIDYANPLNSPTNPIGLANTLDRLGDSAVADPGGTLYSFIPIWPRLRAIDNTTDFCSELLATADLGTELTLIIVGGKAFRTPSAVGALDDVSRAAFGAADDVGSFTVKAKHLPGAGGSWNKFAQGVDPHRAIQDALRSGNAQFLPNPNLPNTGLPRDLVTVRVWGQAA